MSAVLNDPVFARAQDIYDAQIPADQDEDEVWTESKVKARQIPDSEIEQFICEFAERGFYLDEVGDIQKPDLEHAVCQAYARGVVGETIGPAIWRWASVKVRMGCWF